MKVRDLFDGMMVIDFVKFFEFIIGLNDDREKYVFEILNIFGY